MDIANTMRCTLGKRRAHKAALTRAINSRDPQKVQDACRKAVQDWNECGFWPDDWNRWEIALNDSRPLHAPYLALEDL